MCVSHTQKPPKAATDDDNKTLTTAATTRKHASFRSILSEREREGVGGGGRAVTPHIDTSVSNYKRPVPVPVPWGNVSSIYIQAAKTSMAAFAGTA